MAIFYIVCLFFVFIFLRWIGFRMENAQEIQAQSMLGRQNFANKKILVKLRKFFICDGMSGI